MVDLPEAERPVNQIVKPRCLRFVLRSLRESDGCHVMLLFGLVSVLVLRWWGIVGLTLPLWSTVREQFES
jgi:hypothetical protein